MLASLIGFSALSQELPKAPEIKTEQKPDSGLKTEPAAQDDQQSATPSPGVVPEVLSDRQQGKCDAHCDNAEKEGTEFWPPLWGYRLKITDTLVAAFTALLFFATLALWWSTRRLVRGADDTAKRQLRAYISINPVEIATSDREERFAQITCVVSNHGQTPAREVNYIYSFDVLPNPLPRDFVFPAAATPVSMDASVFPRSEMRVWFNFNRLLSTEEFTAVETNNLRLHLWGTAFYRTAFGQRCKTKITASVGGPAFIATLRATRRNTRGPGFNWTYESGHGDGD